MVENQRIATHLRRFLYVQVSCGTFRIDDIGVAYVREFDDRERADKPDVCTLREWQDLDGDSERAGGLYESLQLGPHDGGTTDGTAQDSLVKHSPQLKRVITSESCLTSHPECDEAVHAVLAVHEPDSAKKGTSIVLGLQQPMDKVGLVGAQ